MSPPVLYNNFSLKIGYTTDSVWKQVSLGYDTFKTGLVTVASGTTYTFTDTTTGKWVKFPMMQGSSFYYDKTKKFVVQVEQGPLANNLGIDFFGSNPGSPAWRTLSGAKDSLRSSASSLSHSVMDLGFDLAANSVQGTGSFSSFNLEPNPLRKAGTCNLSFRSQQALKDINVSLTSVTGQRVWGQAYKGSGNEFRASIPVGEIAAGAYVVRVEADGEAINSMVVVQE